MTRELRALLARGQDIDHEEAIQLCDAALKKSRNDLEVQQTKAVALLKLDRFDEAVKLFESAGSGLQDKAALEYAYALYKHGQLARARDVAKRLDTKAGKHLEAQASYRLEDFANARQLYSDLQGSAGDEENDIRINGRATDAQLEWKQQGSLVSSKKASREDFEAFESAYNVGCGCIARGELNQASLLLQKARDLCAASPDLDEDEKKAELLPIQVQQLYVLSMQAKTEQADALASEIVVADIPDASTQVIASINRHATSRNSRNPFLAHRSFHEAPKVQESDSLFEFQKALLDQNEVALDLMSFKFKGVKRSTAQQLREDAAPTTSARINSISAANAAAHAQNELGKLGVKSLLPLLERRPTDVGLLMTIVQLYVLTNNRGAALKVAEDFLKRLEEYPTAAAQDVRFAPGLVAIVVSLHMIEHRRSHVRTELAKAASYWRHRSNPPPALLRFAGLSLLDSDAPEDREEARATFESLRRADASDRFAAAGFLAASLEDHTADSSRDTGQLSSISRLTAGVDVAALEKAGVAQLASGAPSILTRKRAAEETTKPTKKRVRKSRVPKDADPSKPPDPERWLPLKDRSTYRPKGKKGKQKQAAQTQGSNEKPEVASNPVSEQAKPQAVGGGGGGSGGGGGGKAKKKKGKK